MPGADNQIVIEALAKVEQAQREISQAAGAIAAALDKIPERKEIDLDISTAEADLNRLERDLREIQTSAGKVTRLNLPVDQALANVDRVLAKVRELGPAVAGAVGPGDIQPASEAVRALEATFIQAEGAVQRFEAQASQGGKGAARSFALAKVAVADLEAQVAKLRASGANVTALETRVASLRAGLDRGAATMGKFRAAARDVDDELRRATIGAGEFEGQIGSLEDIVNQVNPAFGNTVSKLLAVQATIGIITGVAQQLDSGLQNLAKTFGATDDQAKKFSESLDVENRVLEKLVATVRTFFGALTSDDVDGAVENARRAASALEVEQRKLDGAAQHYAETIKGEVAAIERRNEILRRAIAIVKENGNVTAAAADQVVASLNEQIEATRRLGGTAADLEGLRDHFVALARDARLTEAINDVRKFANELEAGGGVTKEQADKITADIKRIIAEIRLLPQEEQRAFSDRIRTLEGFAQRYREFTTEYEKEAEKQVAAAKKAAEKEAQEAERRKKALAGIIETWRELARAIDSASSGDIKGPSASGASDLAQQIAEAEAELERLNAQGFLTPEDLNRIDELQTLIRNLKIDLDRAGAAAGEARGGVESLGSSGAAALGQLGSAVEDLIFKSDEFKETFADLPPAFQDAVQTLVTGFLSDLKNGLVESGVDVERFIYQFTTLLQQGGAASAEFLAQLQGAAGGVDGLAAAFDNLRGGSDGVSSSLQAAAESLGVTAEKGDTLFEIFQKVQRKLEEGGQVVRDASDDYAAVSDASSALGEELIAVGEAGDSASAGIIKTKDEIIQVAKAGEEAAKGGIIKVGETIYEIGERAKEAAEPVGELATAAEKTATATADIGASASKSAEALPALAEGATAAGEAAAAAVEPLKGVAEQIGAISDKGGTAATAVGNTATELSKIAETGEAVATGATKSAEGLDAIAAGGEKAAVPLVKISDALARIAEAPAAVEKLVEAVGTLEAAGPTIEKAAGALQVLEDAVDELPAASEGLQGIADGVERLAAAAPAIEKELAPALKLIPEALKGIEVVAQGMLDLATGTERMRDAAPATAEATKGLGVAAKGALTPIQQLGKAIGEMAQKTIEANAALRAEVALLESITNWARQAAAALRDLAAAQAQVAATSPV